MSNPRQKQRQYMKTSLPESRATRSPVIRISQKECISGLTTEPNPGRPALARVVESGPSFSCIPEWRFWTSSKARPCNGSARLCGIPVLPRGSVSSRGILTLPAMTESPFALSRCYLSRRRVCHSLGQYYPARLAPMDSCDRPGSSAPLCLRSGSQSSPVAVSPGWE